MPLFKGQGCKSTPGKAIAYVTDQSKAKYVTSQFLCDTKDYAAQFQRTANRFSKGKKYDERKYYHFKLSCDRTDNVSPERHHEFAERMAAEAFPDNECVIATHVDTATVHSHIIVNAVSFVDGKKFQCNNHKYGKMKDLANSIGKEMGFTELDFRKPAKEKITSKERHAAEERRSWKQKLRDKIDEALEDSVTLQGFEEELNYRGITLTRNTSKTISYKGEGHQAIRGEKLGERYTKPAIVEALNQTMHKIELYRLGLTEEEWQKQEEERKRAEKEKEARERKKEEAIAWARAYYAGQDVGHGNDLER